MGARFETLIERRLFPELGLLRTYVTVPTAEMKTYAWGYHRDDKPIRGSPGMLATEAYGVKSNAVDMICFLEVNMGACAVSGNIARGRCNACRVLPLRRTHPDLIWEQYPYPVELDKIVAGNSTRMILNSTPTTAIDPPLAPRGDVILNKTGSTNGFGAYVAYVPARKIGIVMLANKNYPKDARAKAAHQVLSRLAE